MHTTEELRTIRQNRCQRRCWSSSSKVILTTTAAAATLLLNPCAATDSHIKVRAFLDDERLYDCMDYLGRADKNGNKEIDHDEFVDFVDLYSRGRIGQEEYRYLPLSLVSIFTYTSCGCYYEEGDPNCCSNQNGHIDIDDNGSKMVEARFENVCGQVAEAIDEYVDQAPPPPKDSCGDENGGLGCSEGQSCCINNKSPDTTDCSCTSSNSGLCIKPNTDMYCIVGSQNVVTNNPSRAPSLAPSLIPSSYPSSAPSSTPSHSPSTEMPTSNPSHMPTLWPSAFPSWQPSTNNPTFLPTTQAPVGDASLINPVPLTNPTDMPSSSPSTMHPTTSAPVTAPTETDSPTNQPITEAPITVPSSVTNSPTLSYTAQTEATKTPNMAPTVPPTSAPIAPASLFPTKNQVVSGGEILQIKFGYGARNADGINAKEAFERTNNTLRDDLVAATRTIVKRTLNMTDDTLCGEDRRNLKGQKLGFSSSSVAELIDRSPPSPLLRGYAHHPVAGYPSGRHLAEYVDCYPKVQITRILDDFCINPFAESDEEKCMIIKCEVTILLPQSETSSTVRRNVMDGLSRSFRDGSFLDAIPDT